MELVGVAPHTYLLTATEATLATPGAVTLPDALLTARTASPCFSASAAGITTGQGEDLRSSERFQLYRTFDFRRRPRLF